MQDGSLNIWLETKHSVENKEKHSIFSNWEAIIKQSDMDVDVAVRDFVNNLGYNLTSELLTNFDNYKSTCWWLTDSDIRLKSIEEVYHNNKNKMPGELEEYLLNMLKFLIHYKTAKGTLASLSEVIRLEMQLKELSQTTSDIDWKDLPPYNSRIKPAEGVTLLNA